MIRGAGEKSLALFYMQKMLLQTSSGCVFPWSPSLAEMPDMVPYERKPKTEPVVEVPVVVEPDQEDIKAIAQAVLTKRKK
jgi:hypothetical protein